MLCRQQRSCISKKPRAGTFCSRRRKTPPAVEEEEEEHGPERKAAKALVNLSRDRTLWCGISAPRVPASGKYTEQSRGSQQRASAHPTLYNTRVGGRESELRRVFPVGEHRENGAASLCAARSKHAAHVGKRTPFPHVFLFASYINIRSRRAPAHVSRGGILWWPQAAWRLQ